MVNSTSVEKIEAIVHQWADEGGEQNDQRLEVDEAVLEYIVDVLCETEDDDDIRDVLRPMLTDLWCGERERCESLVEELVKAKDTLCPEEIPVPLEAPVVKGSAEEQHRCSDQARSTPEDSSTSQDAHDRSLSMTEEELAAVNMLASLLSLEDVEDAHRRYLCDIYRSYRSNMDATANALLSKTTAEIQKAIDIRGKRREPEATPPVVDPDIKASIVSKYHLQALPSRERESSSTRQRKKENEYIMKGVFAADETKKQTSVRFRDGAVVSTKGEKFIIEKKEEWDGGSRGRVKSKGKRGVGWV